MRSIYADWERGDFSRADWADPEIEVVFAEGPAPGPRKGFSETAVDSFDEYRFQAEEYRDLDGDRVLVLHRVFGRGKASGIELNRLRSRGREARLFHIQNGKVARIVAYFDHRRAFADLGVAPEESRDPR